MRRRTDVSVMNLDVAVDSYDAVIYRVSDVVQIAKVSYQNLTT